MGHVCWLVGWLMHSLGTCIGRSSAASMRHATGEQPRIRPDAACLLSRMAQRHRAPKRVHGKRIARRHALLLAYPCYALP
jgi:hypothetical protein